MAPAVVTESRFFCRDIQTHVWGFRGLTAAVKAWIAGTSPGKGILKAHPWAAWVICVDLSFDLSLSPLPCKSV